MTQYCNNMSVSSDDCSKYLDGVKSVISFTVVQETVHCCYSLVVVQDYAFEER